MNSKNKTDAEQSRSINPFIFRAYDIRGIYPDDFNEEVISKITLAFTQFYPDAQKVVLAYDARKSSPSLAESVGQALLGQGKEVSVLGLAPDPLLSFSLAHFDFDAGMMVTASHNPKEYNGLVLDLKSGPIPKEDLVRIKELVLSGKLSDGQRPKKLEVGRPTVFNPEESYLNYVLPKIKLKRRLKIVIDSGNGAMGFLPEKAFKKLGCQVKTIFGEPDGNFPNHEPDPYREENLKHLKQAVKKEKADIGFAFDGDGDRVILVDNQGRRVLEDYCLLLLVRQILDKNKGSVVCGVRISDVFLEEMEKMGVETHFSICHHNEVIGKIKELNAVFGGEITSHYFFPKEYYLVNDALFSALKLAEIVSEHNDFAAFIGSLPKIYATSEVFIETPDEEKFAIIEKLKEYLKKEKIDFIDIDGVRISLDNGWALARASNTSPYIKLRFEGKTEKDLAEIQKQAKQIFRQGGIEI